MTDLSHVNDRDEPTMVDVGDKTPTDRSAHARCVVELPEEISARFDGADFQTKKGPVFHTAIIAGTMAVKKTSDLIPFCHPLGIEGCRVELQLTDSGNVEINCHVRVHHKTGVEMEALMGASVAGLTVYDMLKAISHEMVIRDTRLISKAGGKRDVSGV